MGSLRKATLLFLREGNRLLLARKKRGFGVGRYNGVGGKVNELVETVEEAAKRETLEEIGVRVGGISKVAVLKFYFPLVSDGSWDQEVHVFFSNEWEGEPNESEEMLPEWFDLNNLPFHQMWPSDFHWLPRVLQGELITGAFSFGENDSIREFTVTSGLP